MRVVDSVDVQQDPIKQANATSPTGSMPIFRCHRQISCMVESVISSRRCKLSSMLAFSVVGSLMNRVVSRLWRTEPSSTPVACSTNRKDRIRNVGDERESFGKVRRMEKREQNPRSGRRGSYVPESGPRSLIPADTSLSASCVQLILFPVSSIALTPTSHDGKNSSIESVPDSSGILGINEGVLEGTFVESHEKYKSPAGKNTSRNI